ncbi:MAG: hypothetical protein H7A25_16745 [Leptospiraceae bacterium]|nr:hypothetical protein [Leptospiraceae bacterium]MCP5501553.1 hypothetical protein [Leptospiraceae bacterium]
MKALFTLFILPTFFVLNSCNKNITSKEIIADRLISKILLIPYKDSIFYEGKYISFNHYSLKNKSDLNSYQKSIEGIFQLNFKSATKSRFNLLHRCNKATENKILYWSQQFFNQIYPIYFKYEVSYNFRLVYFKDREELKNKTRIDAFGFYLQSDHNNPYHLTNRILYSYCNSGIGTLWHELIHAFIDVNSPLVPPDWFGEGLASFYEEASLINGKVIDGYTNWRMPALIKAIKNKDTYPLSKFLRAYHFHQVHSYPQARFLFCYLWMKGIIQAFSRNFVYLIIPKYDKEIWGDKAIETLEELTKKDIEEINKEFEKLSLKFKKPQKLNMEKLGKPQ